MKTGIKVRLVILLLLAVIVFPAPALESPGRTEYLYALKLYEEKYFDLAAEQLERCLRDFPALAEADEAQYLLGEAYLRSGDPDRARAAFLRTAIVYPQSQRAPEALFKVGETLANAGRHLEAAQAFERVQGFYSGSLLAPLALQRAALEYSFAGEFSRSDDVSTLLIEKYPDAPAASRARLERAASLIDRGDLLTAEHYIRWVAERSGMDSLSARAWLALGRFHRDQFEFADATEAYRRCFEQFPRDPSAPLARLELADLQNVRGQTDLTLETLAPLVTSSDFQIRIASVERLGDANYYRRDFEQAIAFYDTAAAYSRTAAIKAGWTNELIGRKRAAFDRYLRAVNIDDSLGLDARLRAALLAFDLDMPERAAAFWSEIVRKIEDLDQGDRIMLELARARARARQPGGSAAADTLLRRWPFSPYADDALMIAARESFDKGNYAQAAQRCEDLLRRYPASELADSASRTIAFLQAFHLRGEGLIERMAELSSLPQNRTNPVRWALDWGDFYLDLFKDPVKAVDQFDRAIDDIAATSDDRAYALYRGGIAYLLLARSALREQNDYSLAMYLDSATARSARLNKIESHSDRTRDLACRLLLFQYESAPGDSALEVVIRQTDALLAKFDLERTHPDNILYYLEACRRTGRIDEVNFPRLRTLAERTVEAGGQNRTNAEIRRWEARALARIGKRGEAVETRRILVAEYQDTPAAAVVLLDLASDSGLTQRERLDYINLLKARYPYRLDPVQFPLLEADLLDRMERPLEALALRERADQAAVWGQPHLTLLETPSPAFRVERARALRRAGEFTRAAEDLRVALNFDPAGPYAASALYELALLERSRDNHSAALNLIDTLVSRFPKSSEAAISLNLKPELYFGTGNYRAAQSALTALIAASDNRDSIYHYQTLNVAAMLRLDLIDEAKNASNALYKTFKEHPDLDNARAYLTLERGRSLERAKKWDEAREQYRTVREKYPLSVWADDAAFHTGSSLLDQGRNDDAAKAFERLVADHPESPIAPRGYLLLGKALYRAERHSEALAALRRVWENRRATTLWQPAFESLTTVYRELRFWDAALRLTREYLERFPNAPDALDRRMDIAQFHLELRDYDEAIRQYRPLLPLADAEREAEIQYYIGEAYSGKGDYRAAILEFLKVKVLGRKTKLDWGVTAIYQAGTCYEKLQDWEGAARMYQKIITEMGEASNYGRAAKQKLDSLPRAEASQP